MKSKQCRIFATLTVVIVIGGCAASTGGLVESIVKAPIVPDGDVIGAVTDLTINLAIDPDPAVSGLSMKTGETIEITLPDEFVFADPDNYPIMDLFGAPNCTFEQLTCSTALLLHGWPQHPILPSFPPGETPSYTISFDKQLNRITLTVQRSLNEVPLPGPGVKQVHLMLLGFRNPEEPGDYPIHVSINGADGQQRHTGKGMVTIRSAVAPSLNVTSIFDENGAEPPNLNTIYQSVRPGEPAPLAWDFLAWDAEGKAFDRLLVEQSDASTGRLTRAGNIVGHFEIDVPPGAEGHRIEGGPSITLDHEYEVLVAVERGPTARKPIGIRFRKPDTLGNVIDDSARDLSWRNKATQGLENLQQRQHLKLPRCGSGDTAGPINLNRRWCE